MASITSIQCDKCGHRIDRPFGEASNSFKWELRKREFENERHICPNCQEKEEGKEIEIQKYKEAALQVFYDYRKTLRDKEGDITTDREAIRNAASIALQANVESAWEKLEREKPVVVEETPKLGEEKVYTIRIEAELIAIDYKEITIAAVNNFIIGAEGKYDEIVELIQHTWRRAEMEFRMEVANNDS